MKKYIFSTSILSLVILVSSALSSNAISHGAPIKIFINDTFLKTDVEPIIVEGRTLVPIRNLADALSLSIEYNANFNEVYIKTPDYTPDTTVIPENLNEILNSVNESQLLNLDLSQMLRAIDIGKNLTDEELSEYVYELPKIYDNDYKIDSLYGRVTIDTPFLEIVKQSHNNPDYSINSALTYLKKYYLAGKISFSFSIYGNGENFYKNSSISLIQNSKEISKFYIRDYGHLEKAEHSAYTHTFTGSVSFDFPKIDFSQDAILRFDYIDGIGRSFLVDFNNYI